MDIVKKNILSIACGVVAIAAIIAWFWPVGGMFATLQGDLDGRAKTYTDVETLRTAQRKLPSLVLEGGPRSSPCSTASPTRRSWRSGGRRPSR